MMTTTHIQTREPRLGGGGGLEGGLEGSLERGAFGVDSGIFNSPGFWWRGARDRQKLYAEFGTKY